MTDAAAAAAEAEAKQAHVKVDTEEEKKEEEDNSSDDNDDDVGGRTERLSEAQASRSSGTNTASRGDEGNELLRRCREGVKGKVDDGDGDGDGDGEGGGDIGGVGVGANDRNVTSGGLLAVKPEPQASSSVISAFIESNPRPIALEKVPFGAGDSDRDKNNAGSGFSGNHSDDVAGDEVRRGEEDVGGVDGTGVGVGTGEVPDKFAKPDHGENFVPGAEMAPANMAPEPLDHFKRGYRERAELREREMGHLNKDFENDRKILDDGNISTAGAGAGAGASGGSITVDLEKKGSGEEDGGIDRGSEVTRGRGRGDETMRGRGDGDEITRGRGLVRGGRKGAGGGVSTTMTRGSHAGGSDSDSGSKGRGGVMRRLRDRDGSPLPSHPSELAAFEVADLIDRIASAPPAHLDYELNRARELSPSSFESGKAVTAILSHLARRRNMGAALAVWAWTEKCGIPRNVYHYNSLISVCEKTKDWRRALDLLSQMERSGVEKNEVTFSSAISACEKSGNWRVAIDLLDKMKAEGVKQTPIAYNAAISACEKGLNPSMALEVYERMKAERVRPTVVTFSALISACEKGQQWKLALEVLEEMKAAGHGTNVIAYSAAISALSKGQQWEKALELFREIERSGGRPSVVTYNATMTALEKGLQWERALDLFDEMKARGMPVTVVSYGCAICACEKGYQWRQCLDYLDEMTEVGIKKNVIIFGAAMSCMEKSCRADIAFQLMDRMKLEGVHPNVHIYNSAISACARCHLWKKGYELFQEMDCVGVAKDVVTYNAVLDAVSSHVELARRLFQEGVERGFYARVSRLGTQWLELDLHFLSLGGGEVALGWWFENALLPYLGNSSKLAAVKSIDIVTGYGKTRMRGARQGNDGMRKRVRAMLHFMGMREVEQPNKGRIHIDKEALQAEVSKNKGRIIFDAEGYERWKREQTTVNAAPDVKQIRRGRKTMEANTSTLEVGSRRDQGTSYDVRNSQDYRAGEPVRSNRGGVASAEHSNPSKMLGRLHDRFGENYSQGRNTGNRWNDPSRHRGEEHHGSSWSDRRPSPTLQNDRGQGSRHPQRFGDGKYDSFYHRGSAGEFQRREDSSRRPREYHSYPQAYPPQYESKPDQFLRGHRQKRSLSPGEYGHADSRNRDYEGNFRSDWAQNRTTSDLGGSSRGYNEATEHCYNDHVRGQKYMGRGYDVFPAPKRNRGNDGPK